jgi:hypothetical protein
MKKLAALFAATLLGSTAAIAGGMEEPIKDETPTAVAPTSSSSPGIIVLVMLLLAGAAIAGGGSDGNDEAE